MIAVGAILFAVLIVAWLVAPSEPQLETEASKTGKLEAEAATA